MVDSILSLREEYIPESDEIAVIAEIKIWKYVSALKTEVEKKGYTAFRNFALAEMKRSILEDFEKSVAKED